MEGSQHILTLNAGGLSLRAALFDWQSEEKMADEYIDWGEKGDQEVEGHGEAFEKILEKLDTTHVCAVGHRVVHGGTKYQEAVAIDAAVKEYLASLNPLAPLHNPVALTMIEKAQERFPDIPHVAAFDTAFHATLPPHAYVYPLPYKWYTEWGIRRFGFHGLSLAYCAGRATEMVGKAPEQANLVICHLGSGCSITAVRQGCSVATTMGLTPLEGVMMSTRSGSVDPGLLLYLLKEKQVSITGLENALNEESGLKGVSGISSDLRDILPAKSDGDARAALAVDLYTGSIREGIGAMLAHTGKIDVLVFTGGVGEHLPEVRAAVAAPLEWLGIELDEARNREAEADADVAAGYAPIRILVISAREELIIQRETRRALTRKA